MWTGNAAVAAEWIGQILSIVGMVLTVGSMQFKKVGTLYRIQLIAAVSFLVSYFLLSSPAGGILNFFGLTRAIVLVAGKRCQSRKYLFLLLAELALCGAACFWLEGWLSLIPTVAQLIGTIGFWTRNGRKLRILQFVAVSPLWLTYNCIIFSLGGIGCEAFNLISVLVSVWRFGWRALGEEQE